MVKLRQACAGQGRVEKYRSLKALSEAVGTHGGQACPPSEVDDAAITLLMMSKSIDSSQLRIARNKLFRAVAVMFEREARRRRDLECEVANLRSMLCAPHFVPFVVPNNFGAWLGAPSPQL